MIRSVRLLFVRRSQHCFVAKKRSEVTPTFVLMDLQPTKVTSYIYQLRNDEVAVEKTEYQRPQQEATTAPQ